MFEDLKPIGFDEGYAKGFAVGRHEGFQQGSDIVYDSDRAEAFEQGRLAGCEDSYQRGREDGYHDGTSAGYDEGYFDGIDAALFDELPTGINARPPVGTVLPRLTKSERIQVWRKTGGLCFYCGTQLRHPVKPSYLQLMHVEHLVPRQAGGPNHMLNLVPSCHSCNSAKSAKDPVRFIIELVERMTSCP